MPAALKSVAATASATPNPNGVSGTMNDRITAGATSITVGKLASRPSAPKPNQNESALQMCVAKAHAHALQSTLGRS